MNLHRLLAKYLVDITGLNWTFPGTVSATGFVASTGAPLKGSRWSVSIPNMSAAGGHLTGNLFMADFACKLVSARMSHGTVCDAADVFNIEKCTSGEDLGAGDALFATGWTLNSTANTPVAKNAITTASVNNLAAGDRLCGKMTNGDGTDWDEGVLTLTFEVL